jgi:hypothetical protein
MGKIIIASLIIICAISGYLLAKRKWSLPGEPPPPESSPETPPTEPIPPEAEGSFRPEGVNIAKPFHFPEKQIEALRAMGIDWLRIPLGRKGSDPIPFIQAGFHILAVTDNYAREVPAYPGIPAWEFRNEANLMGKSPADYLVELRAFYSYMRRFHPEKIILASCAGGGMDQRTNWNVEFFRLLKSEDMPRLVLNIHTYNDAIFNELPIYKEALSGLENPVWITEFGVSDFKKQAEVANRCGPLLREVPRLEKIFWWALFDGAPGEDPFSLVWVYPDKFVYSPLGEQLKK